MIPSITGDAASWKYNCHAVDESKNWKKTINKIKKKLKYITKKKIGNNWTWTNTFLCAIQTLYQLSHIPK